MGLLAGKQVYIDFAAGKAFTYIRHQAVIEAYVLGIVSKGLYPLFPGYEHSSFVMEFLADDNEIGLAEHFVRPYNGIESPEPGIIQENDLVRDSPFYQ